MFLNRIDVYSWMIVALLVFSASGAYTFGVLETVPQTLIAIAAANAFDVLARRIRTGQTKFTKTATITGLFIGQLLPLSAEFYLPLLAAGMAIASKHLINLRRRHVFNPALFSLLVVALAFSVLPSWWGSFAFPASWFPMLSMAAVVILGLVITFRQNRHDLVWPFVGALLLFNFVGTTIFPEAPQFSLAVDSTILYAAFFMLVEPRTSPIFRKARIAYGILAAAVFTAFNFVAPEYNLLAMILVANLFVLPLDKYLRG